MIFNLFFNRLYGLLKGFIGQAFILPSRILFQVRVDINITLFNRV